MAAELGLGRSDGCAAFDLSFPFGHLSVLVTIVVYNIIVYKLKDATTMHRQQGNHIFDL